MSPPPVASPTAPCQDIRIRVRNDSRSTSTAPARSEVTSKPSPGPRAGCPGLPGRSDAGRKDAMTERYLAALTFKSERGVHRQSDGDR
jgi:hypothetical protein